MSFVWEARRSPIEPDGLRRSRRSALGLVTATVLCLHAGLLLVRPDASGARHLSAARAMAVRLLPSRVPDVVARRETPLDVPATTPVAPSEKQNAGVSQAATSRSPGPVDLPERPQAPGASTGSVASALRPPDSSAPAANSTLAPEPDYLLGAQMDPGPRPLGSIDPEYPDAANLQEGKVVLRLLISETGAVDNVAVVRAEPRGVFEDAALAAFRAAKFSPGLILGTPVKSQITVEVEFMPINRGARIAGRTY